MRIHIDELKRLLAPRAADPADASIIHIQFGADEGEKTSSAEDFDAADGSRVYIDFNGEGYVRSIEIW